MAAILSKSQEETKEAKFYTQLIVTWDLQRREKRRDEKGDRVRVRRGERGVLGWLNARGWAEALARSVSAFEGLLVLGRRANLDLEFDV